MGVKRRVSRINGSVDSIMEDIEARGLLGVWNTSKFDAGDSLSGNKDDGSATGFRFFAGVGVSGKTKEGADRVILDFLVKLDSNLGRSP